jgi:alpha-glucosidase
VFTRFNAVVGTGWPCWAITNHDIPRVATRWGGANPPMGLLRVAAALQLSLRGTACIYQGDELGLPEAEVAFEDLQDPYGITMWPEYKGRDGCRTPMAWEAAAPDLGFGAAGSTVKPWLPVSESHRALAADQQAGDPASLLSHYRQLLAWRRGVPALIHGDMTLLPVHPQVLAFVREHEGQRMLCAFNLSDTPAEVALEAAGTVRFDPWGALFAPLP